MFLRTLRTKKHEEFRGPGTAMEMCNDANCLLAYAARNVTKWMDNAAGLICIRDGASRCLNILWHRGLSWIVLQQAVRGGQLMVRCMAGLILTTSA